MLVRCDFIEPPEKGGGPTDRLLCWDPGGGWPLVGSWTGWRNPAEYPSPTRSPPTGCPSQLTSLVRPRVEQAPPSCCVTDSLPDRAARRRRRRPTPSSLTASPPTPAGPCSSSRSAGPEDRRATSP